MRWAPFVVLWVPTALVWTAGQLAFRGRDLR